MAGIYGVAAAGGRTISDPCDSLFFCSGAGDGEAWWAAGVTWRRFVDSLESETLKYAPKDTWPPDVKILQATAQEPRELFVDDNKPWVVFKARIEQWAAAQQILRDYAGALAGVLQKAKGIKIKGPADAPPSKSLGAQVETAIHIAGFAVGAWVIFKIVGK